MPTSAPLVLVADDEPSMLELVARHLRTMDDPKLEVIQASDGEEAWRLAREHLPDLVVLDVMMPGMSGWEVCRKIREDVALAHTGVVMLTGIGENLNQMTSPLYGADAYIDKPFEFEDFDHKIRGTLVGRTKQREGIVRPAINGTSGAAKPLPTGEGRPGKAKAVAKKPAAKKPAAKKAAAKKAAAKKPAAKKPAAKKAAAKPAAKKKR
jgi:DNA-binding response OmpR family regulator